MLKGYELGLSLTSSFEFIQVIQGKPTLSPRGALAIIQQSGELAGMKIMEKPDSCTVWMKRRNGMEYELTWTVEDAKRAKLVKPDGAWETYPAQMLKWRTVGFVADVLFADIIGGLKRADELGGDIDREGNVIEGQWTSTAPAASIPMPAQSINLDELVERYGADAVLAACGGMPGTDAEVQLAASVLEAGNEN